MATTVRLSLRRISDELSDFDYLFNLLHQCGEGSAVIIDFSNCNFLTPNAVVFLGGLARLIEYKSGTCDFDWNTLSPAVRANLAQNGFVSTFGGAIDPWDGNSVPYREDQTLDVDGLLNYLRTKWLDDYRIHLSQELEDYIIGKVWEIYDNAFEHSQSPIGIFSCGQYYPQKHELKLAVVDFGVGIPYNVRKFRSEETLEAGYAISWAFKSGNTTKSGSRGLGLDILKDFIRINKGRLEVFSHEGYGLISKDTEEYSSRLLTPTFEGTLFNLTLKCDARYYHLASST